MTNWDSQRQAILGGTLASPLSPTRAVRQLALDDVGRCVTRGVHRPRRLDRAGVRSRGCRVDLGPDADAFGHAPRRRVHYTQLPWARFRERVDDEDYRMFRSFEQVGSKADLAAARAVLPDVHSLEQHVLATGWLPA